MGNIGSFRQLGSFFIENMRGFRVFFSDVPMVDLPVEHIYLAILVDLTDGHHLSALSSFVCCCAGCLEHEAEVEG